MSGWATLWPSIAIIIVALIWNETIEREWAENSRIRAAWDQEIKKTLGALREFLKGKKQ